MREKDRRVPKAELLTCSLCGRRRHHPPYPHGPGPQDTITATCVPLPPASTPLRGEPPAQSSAWASGQVGPLCPPGKVSFVAVWSQHDNSHLKNCESGQFLISKKKIKCHREARKGDKAPLKLVHAPTTSGWEAQAPGECSSDSKLV